MTRAKEMRDLPLAIDVDASGRVGIGTSSPSQNLHISSSDHTRALITGGTNKYAELQFENDAQKFAMGVQDDDKFFLYNSTGTSTVLTVDTSNNVGIGGATVTDSNILNLQGDGSAVNVGTVFNKTNGTPQIWAWQVNNTTNDFRIHNYTASTNPLVLTTGGKLGVGATTPECGINIFGQSTSNWADSNAMYNKDHPAFLKITNGQETVGVESGIVMRSKTTGAGVWSMYAKQTANYLADLHFRGRNAGTTSAVRMTLKSNGNVGIGTTNPLVKLDMGVTSPGDQVIALRQNGVSRTTLGITANYGVRVASPSDASATGAMFEVGQNNASDGTTYQNTRFSVLYNGNIEIPGNGIDFTGVNGKTIIKTGSRTGTGTFTLFTNGSSVTQSAGLVEVWGIYGTPSNGRYDKYIIGGNRSITSISATQTASVPQASVAWSGANLQVSNSNSSLYYAVRVTLCDIGYGWSPTWGNFPGMD